MTTKLNQAVVMAVSAVSCATVALFTPDWAQNLLAATYLTGGTSSRPALSGTSLETASFNTSASPSTGGALSQTIPVSQVLGYGAVRVLVTSGANNATVPPSGTLTVEFCNSTTGACTVLGMLPYELSTRVLYLTVPASLGGVTGFYRFTNVIDNATSGHTLTIESVTLPGLPNGLPL